MGHANQRGLRVNACCLSADKTCPFFEHSKSKALFLLPLPPSTSVWLMRASLGIKMAVWTHIEETLYLSFIYVRRFDNFNHADPLCAQNSVIRVWQISPKKFIATFQHLAIFILMTTIMWRSGSFISTVPFLCFSFICHMWHVKSEEDYCIIVDNFSWTKLSHELIFSMQITK